MLKQQHGKQLLESGLSGEFIRECAADGWVRTGKDGLEFPYFKADGALNGFVRTRLDVTTKGGPKYIQEKGSGSRLYAPGGTDDHSPARPLLIVEGEKKTLSAWERLSDEMDVVGVGGVWNWVVKGTKGHRELIEEFEEIPLKRRRVYVCFDSDTADKPKCQEAEAALLHALKRAGARVRVMILDREEKGLDDWFVRWGNEWRENFRKLTLRAASARPATDLTDVYDKVYSSREMLDGDFPIPKFFMGNITSEGDGTGLIGEGCVTIIHGAANLGKTYLTMQLACHIAMGEETLGYPAGPAGTRVLMLQGELPPGLFARGRLRPIERYLSGEIPPTLNFLNWSFNLAESSRYKEAFGSDQWLGFDRLDQLCEQYKPNVLFIDPLQAYNNLMESSNDQNRELLKRLKQFAIRRNLGIVVVDHDRKNGTGGADDMRGAGNKNDLADTTIGLKPVPQLRGCVALHWDKIRYINAPRPDACVLYRPPYDDNGKKRDAPFFDIHPEFTDLYRDFQRTGKWDMP